MDATSNIGIDLFAGAGGLSHGLSQAGFNMKLGIEIDNYACQTLTNNHPNMIGANSDIRDIIPKKILKQNNIESDSVSLIAGGPPCRGYSVSNRRTRKINNPINHLYINFFTFVKDIHPPLFLLENVEGLVSLEHGQIFRDIIEFGQDLGYYVTWKILSSEKFGIPQKRRRVIFIGSDIKKDNFFDFKIKKQVNVKMAIEAFNEALKIRTLESFPVDHAMTQNNLGTAYGSLGEVRDKEENIGRAIAAFNEALKIINKEKYPILHKLIQNNKELTLSHSK